MQSISVIDWLKTYRFTSFVYCYDNLPHLSLQQLGQAIRFQCASSVIEDADLTVCDALDLLAVTMASVAYESGMDGARIDTGSLFGVKWSLVIRRCSVPEKDAIIHTLTPAIPPHAEFIITPTPEIDELCTIWDKAESVPLLLEIPDEKLGLIARPVLMSLFHNTDIFEAVTATGNAVFLALHLLSKGLSSIDNDIINFTVGDKELGDWTLSISSTGKPRDLRNLALTYGTEAYRK